MRSLHRNLCALLIAVPMAAIAADSAQLAAGRWEEKLTTTAVNYDGQAIPADQFGDEPTISYTCVTPAEARDPARYFLYNSKGGNCEDPTGTVGGGRITMATKCTDKDFGAGLMEGEGQYGRDSFRVAFTARLDVKGRPMVMESVMEGRFIGTCKGDERG